MSEQRYLFTPTKRQDSSHDYQSVCVTVNEPDKNMRSSPIGETVEKEVSETISDVLSRMEDDATAFGSNLGKSFKNLSANNRSMSFCLTF